MVSPLPFSTCAVVADAIAGQQTFKDSVFPYVFRCQSPQSTLPDVLEWVTARREELLERTRQHGAVLFRGFPLPTVDEFDGFVQSLQLPNFPYRQSLSNAVRINRTERVFSANEAPPDVRIYFHHEMAQTPIYPERILFYCEQAAEAGGETPICRSDLLYERLAASRPDFLRDCETRGLRYTNVMPDTDDAQSGMGRSWQSTLDVNSRDAAEARLAELNYTWRWLPDGCLKVTSPLLPAVMEVSPGRKTFFNQMIAAFCGWKDSRNDPSEAIRYGDGSQLDAAAVMEAVNLAQELSFAVDWQAGDSVLIDNRIVMHARNPFVGKRKVLASLTDARQQSFPPPAH